MYANAPYIHVINYLLNFSSFSSINHNEFNFYNLYNKLRSTKRNIYALLDKKKSKLVLSRKGKGIFLKVPRPHKSKPTGNHRKPVSNGLDSIETF